MNLERNPITIAREQGRKAGLDPKLNLGLNPHVKGREPALWEAWRQGYESTVERFTVQTKAKFDGIPHGGTEDFPNKPLDG